MRVWLCWYQNWSAFFWNSGEWFVRMLREDCVFVQCVEFGVVRSPGGSFLQQADWFCDKSQLPSTRPCLFGAILSGNPASWSLASMHQSAMLVTS